MFYQKQYSFLQILHLKPYETAYCGLNGSGVQTVKLIHSVCPDRLKAFFVPIYTLILILVYTISDPNLQGFQILFRFYRKIPYLQKLNFRIIAESDKFNIILG